MESTIQEKKPGTNINTADALWAIISAQPRKVRKELAIRLQDEFPIKDRHATGLDEALEDIKEGRMSGPFYTPDELFEHLKVEFFLWPIPSEQPTVLTRTLQK